MDLPSSLCGLPFTARAYTVNITVIQRADFSHIPVQAVTLWQDGNPNRPNVPTVRDPAGYVIAIHTTIPAGSVTGSEGKIQVYTTDQTELIIDVTGYYTESSGGLVFYPVPPCRVVDTRENQSAPSPYYDPPIEAGLGLPALAAATERTFQIGGTTRCGTVPITAGAYALNLTVVPPGFLGFLTVWPANLSRPTISNLNDLQGQYLANAAIVQNLGPYGSPGAIKAYASETTHLLIDITGYFAPPRSTNDGMEFNTLTACRVANQVTLASNLKIPVAGLCDVPAEAEAFATNVTLKPTTSAFGYLTVWPSDTLQPVVSLINALDGLQIANSQLVLAGTSGDLSVFGTDPAKIDVDVSGYFTLPSGSQVTTLVEVNLGGVPLNHYFLPNNVPGESLLTSACSASTIIKNCYQQFFTTGPNGYIAQGVKGVRFQFGVGGGYGSRVWDQDGKVRPEWVYNFQQFMNDLKSYGVKRVSPTPALYGFGDDLFTADSAIVAGPANALSSCDGTHKLNFHPWLPFGLNHSNPPPPNSPPDYQDPEGGNEDCWFNNQGYSQAQRSAYSWNWDPYIAMWTAIFRAIRLAGLEVGDIDMSNEVHLQIITVQARLIYDCIGTTCTDVLGKVRRAAAAESIDSWAVTFSTPADQPVGNSSPYCNSYFGDSALLLKTSALNSALDGGRFGDPSGKTFVNGLLCGGNTGTMTTLGKQYDRPRVVDAHIYPCLHVSLNNRNCGSEDATNVATQYYTALRNIMKQRGYRSARAVIGETHSNQNCDGYLASQAGQSVQGYKFSSLFLDRGAQTILRAWNPPQFSPQPCHIVPGQLVPPYQFP